MSRHACCGEWYLGVCIVAYDTTRIIPTTFNMCNVWEWVCICAWCVWCDGVCVLVCVCTHARARTSVCTCACMCKGASACVVSYACACAYRCLLWATPTMLEIDSLKDTSCGACLLCTQMIVERCATPVVLEVHSLEDTSRGAAGFGSTGQ